MQKLEKKEKKKITLSIDSKLYEEFQKYCEENAIMLSRKIEIWMEEFLEKKRKEKLNKS